MTLSALQIANWFVQRAQKDGRNLAIMQLLKLTYIAHGWHLGLLSTPFFSEDIQAWKYGPVIPSLYEAFRPQGIEIKHVVKAANAHFTDEQEEILEGTYAGYSTKSSFELSDITHEADGPWEIATRIGGNYAVIDNGLIRKHYKEKARDAEEAA